MFAVIRLRGTPGLSKKVRDTLEMLRLKAVNNCVLVPETPDYKGMLEVVKHTVTWGEIEKETLVELLKKRLRSEGDKRVDENTLKQITGYGFEELAEALLAGEVKMKSFPKLKPVFRLTPPSKGLKNVKEFYPKGDLGYRGKEINELLKRMI
jgi:large subunit ribosomal protein L30